jgi:mannose-6-phosphate isomerase
MALKLTMVLGLFCIFVFCMERVHLYPMLFEPNLHTIVWGGDRLTQWKGLPQQEHIGESWEVSAVESSPSVVANGVWAGKTLPEVVASAPEEILGKAVAKHYGDKMPLLVKFIDAQKDLSIQVHPDDEMAQREHGKNGKTEMWYILDAEPGACIYSGFKKTLDPEEYKRMVQDGTVVEALAKHEVHAGDVFYIPAGRVHAICGGIMLAEIQQSSDVTYRIFDYNRPGLDGKPRELHTEFAARALNYKVERKYRTDYAVRNDKANLIMESKYFSARVTEVEHEFHRNLLKYDSFIITMCLKGDCVIKVRTTGDEVVVKEGYSCLIPAAVADYDIRPVDGYCKVLDAFIDNQRGGLVNKIHRLFHKNKY